MKEFPQGHRPSSVIFAIIFGLLANADDAVAQGLPGQPTDDQLDAALAEHHSGVLDRGLPEGRRVWFIVDAEGEVVETGVGEPEGLGAHLREEYPETTSDFGFDLVHVTVNGREIPLLWLIPQPPGQL